MPKRRRGVLHGSGAVLLSEKGKEKLRKRPIRPLVSGNAWHVGESSIPAKLPESTSAPNPKWFTSRRRELKDRCHKPHPQQGWTSLPPPAPPAPTASTHSNPLPVVTEGSRVRTPTATPADGGPSGRIARNIQTSEKRIVRTEDEWAPLRRTGLWRLMD